MKFSDLEKYTIDELHTLRDLLKAWIQSDIDRTYQISDLMGMDGWNLTYSPT